MAPNSGLGRYNIIGFFTIVDVARAKEFYRDTLGLRLLSEEPPFALVLRHLPGAAQFIERHRFA